MPSDSDDGLIEHAQRYLGAVEVGWQTDPDPGEPSFQIVRFAGRPGEGFVSFATIGLSGRALTSLAGVPTRSELMMIVPTTLREGTVPSILRYLATGAMRRRRPLERGEVIGPGGPLVAGSGLEALYVTVPAYLPQEFHTYVTPRGAEVGFLWLVPISAAEADWVKAHGAQAFEYLLGETGPDLRNIFRPSMLL